MSTVVQIHAAKEQAADARGARSIDVQTAMLGLAAVFFALLAVLDPDSLPRAFSAPAALFCLFLAAAALAGRRSPAPGTVTVAQKPARLTLGGRLNLAPVFNVAAALCMIATVLIYQDPNRLEGTFVPSRWAILLLPVLGVVKLIALLWGLRHPAGLTLTPQGLRGVRGGPGIDLSWDGLKRVRVASDARGPAFDIIGNSGSVTVRAGAVGGDLPAVATVVDYYRQHPDERHRLTEGASAAQHVADEVAAGRFFRT